MGAAFFACTGELETNFGPAGGLKGQMLPPAEIPEASVTKKPDASPGKKCVYKAPKDAAVETASTPEAGEEAAAAEGGAEEAAATDAGATPEAAATEASTAGDADAGGMTQGDDCKVSWTNDIYPNMTAGGKWSCGNSACHGSGSFSPSLSGNAESFYQTLVGTSVTTGTGGSTMLSVILPCSMSTAESGLLCVTSTSNCGTQMPVTNTDGVTATALSPADVTMIKTWIACGSIDN
jgi:hypothetical protein